jgi:hypothetical protein
VITLRLLANIKSNAASSPYILMIKAANSKKLSKKQGESIRAAVLASGSGQVKSKANPCCRAGFWRAGAGSLGQWGWERQREHIALRAQSRTR